MSTQDHPDAPGSSSAPVPATTGTPLAAGVTAPASGSASSGAVADQAAGAARAMPGPDAANAGTGKRIAQVVQPAGRSLMQRIKRWLTIASWAMLGAAVALLALLATPYGDGIVNWWEASRGYRPLLAVNSWHYQLDKIEPSLPMLAKNTADMLVIDHAKRGGTLALSKEEVAALKVRRDGRRRLVVAYMSIGEAEEFRFYWNNDWKTSPPAWLGEENCAWPQAHRVRFWLDDWKGISFKGPNAFLKRILDAGFDGVYLDRVDIYETFEKERPTARAEMIQFVRELSGAAKQVRPGFLVIAQNAEDLLTDRDYRRAIDGIAKESMLYSGAGGTGVANKADDVAWSKSRLRELLGDRKAVFNVEYLTDIDQIDRVRHELIMGGFVPTFPTRSLDGEEPTLPRDIKAEIGTPERTQAACKPGTAW